MKLSDELITELNEILLEEFGIKLSDTRLKNFAINLILLSEFGIFSKK